MTLPLADIAVRRKICPPSCIDSVELFALFWSVPTFQTHRQKDKEKPKHFAEKTRRIFAGFFLNWIRCIPPGPRRQRGVDDRVGAIPRVGRGDRRGNGGVATNGTAPSITPQSQNRPPRPPLRRRGPLPLRLAESEDRRASEVLGLQVPVEWPRADDGAWKRQLRKPPGGA